jgi:hypothetical protein
MRDLLRSDGVQQMLGRKAEAVAQAVREAGIRVEGVPGRIPLPVTAIVSRGETRARALVILDHPSGRAVESKHAVLAGAIDAARTVL